MLCVEITGGVAYVLMNAARISALSKTLKTLSCVGLEVVCFLGFFFFLTPLDLTIYLAEIRRSTAALERGPG